VQVFFDPSILSYEKLLEYFFAIHDPTSEDQQGNDKGVQYKSVIFITSTQQLTIAQNTIATLNQS
jgi:peptide-methionine (S)-S-oxide reductase